MIMPLNPNWRILAARRSICFLECRRALRGLHLSALTGTSTILRGSALDRPSPKRLLIIDAELDPCSSCAATAKLFRFSRAHEFSWRSAVEFSWRSAVEFSWRSAVVAADV